MSVALNFSTAAARPVPVIPDGLSIRDMFSSEVDLFSPPRRSFIRQFDSREHDEDKRGIKDRGISSCEFIHDHASKSEGTMNS